MIIMVKKFYISFVYALQGIKDFFWHGANAKFQLSIGISYVFLALYMNFSLTDWFIVVIMFSMVLSLEAMNSALEFLADEVSLGKRENIRKAKDIAAGSVLIACIGASIIGGLLVAKNLT